VKVVIESKSYDGFNPGDDGTAKVKAGFTIAGAPARHDAPIRVKFSGNGNLFSGDVIIVNGATADKGVHWPTGVDPLKIDILASLKDFSDIAVFDRITKSVGESLVVEPSSADIGIGEDVTLTAKRLDQNGNPVALDPSKVSWGISPSSVATIVPSGQTAKVTGRGAGTATVTVSLGGTNLTATATVQVKTTFLTREYVGTYVPTFPDGSQVPQPNTHVRFETINFGAEGPHLAMRLAINGDFINGFGFSAYICSTTTNSFAADTGEGPRCTRTFNGTVSDVNHVSTMTWSFTLIDGSSFTYTGTANF
jgi:hypothetical protein